MVCLLMSAVLVVRFHWGLSSELWHTTASMTMQARHLVHADKKREKKIKVIYIY